MKLERTTLDEGVSPVVGVILMVAITVILSAIIATFVLDLGGTVSENPQAGVTFDEDSSDGEVTVQLVSMENADEVSVSSSGDGNWDGDTTLSQVGQTATYEGPTDADGDLEEEDGTITATATLDGKTQVIQTYDYDF